MVSFMMKERDKKSFGKRSWNFSFDEGKKQNHPMTFQLSLKKKVFF